MIIGLLQEYMARNINRDSLLSKESTPKNETMLVSLEKRPKRALEQVAQDPLLDISVTPRSSKCITLAWNTIHSLEQVQMKDSSLLLQNGFFLVLILMFQSCPCPQP